MSPRRPKYLKLYEDLSDKIAAGEWKPGEQLPSEPQLAKDHGLSYMTVRKAIEALVESGKLRRVWGRGTFVAPEMEEDKRPAMGLLLMQNWHTVDPFYFSPLVSGFVSGAWDLGYQVHLADRTEPLLELLKFQELHVQAVACVLLGPPDELDAEQLLDRGVLVVGINEYGGNRRIPSVRPDNRGGARKLVSQLIERGYRSFLYIDGPDENFDAQERKTGMEEALKEAGIPLGAVSTIQGGFHEELTREALDAYLEQNGPPRLIVAASDLSAVGAMRALNGRGLRIPEDVSVSGFGDFRLAGYVNPPLTTVRLPLEEMGRESAAMLHELSRGIRPVPVDLACPVVWRESVL